MAEFTRNLRSISSINGIIFMELKLTKKRRIIINSNSINCILIFSIIFAPNFLTQNYMRIITTLIMAFCLSIAGFAQQSRFNTFSLEAGGGIHMPFLPSDNLDRMAFLSVNQFQVAGRYMFSEAFGLKVQYAHHVFADRKATDESLTQHKMTIEAVYNIGEALNFNYKFYERFAVLMHAGFGVSTLKPNSLSEYEYTPTIQGGLTPLIRLSDKMALYLDGTLVINVSQKY